MLVYSGFCPNSILRRVDPVLPGCYGLYLGHFTRELLVLAVLSGLWSEHFHTFSSRIPTYSRGVPESVIVFPRMLPFLASKVSYQRSGRPARPTEDSDAPPGAPFPPKMGTFRQTGQTGPKWEYSRGVGGVRGSPTKRVLRVGSEPRHVEYRGSRRAPPGPKWVQNELFPAVFRALLAKKWKNREG